MVYLEIEEGTKMIKYPKLNKDDNCKYPERDNCNYDEKQKRCEFMCYDNNESIFSSSRWKCKYVK